MSISTIVNISLYVIIAWFFYNRFARVKGLKNISQTEFLDTIKKDGNNILIDVREQAEYKEGHISNAINIPLSQLKNRILEIPEDKEVILYCQSGMRSKQAARILSKNGFLNLSHLLGGIAAYSGKLMK